VILSPATAHRGGHRCRHLRGRLDRRRDLARASGPARPEPVDPAFTSDNTPCVAADRGRTVVGRLINRLKRWRRTATRYARWAAVDQARLTVAAILLWL